MKTNFGNLVVMLAIFGWLSYRGTLGAKLWPVYVVSLALGFLAITFWR